MTVRDILLALVAEVNDSNQLPYTAKLDKLDSEPSASVQQTGGTRLIEPFVNGGGVTELPFSVTLRVPSCDTKSRADASASLFGLADYFDTITTTGALPDGVDSIKGIDTPSLVARNDDGSEDWRAAFVLEYVQ